MFVFKVKSSDVTTFCEHCFAYSTFPFCCTRQLANTLQTCLYLGCSSSCRHQRRGVASCCAWVSMVPAVTISQSQLTMPLLASTMPLLPSTMPLLPSTMRLPWALHHLWHFYNMYKTISCIYVCTSVTTAMKKSSLSYPIVDNEHDSYTKKMIICYTAI